MQTETTAEIQDNQLLQKAWETVSRIITPNRQGNSFPMIPYAQIALQGSRFEFTAEYDIKQICTQRGLDLALGGIFDHVAGGRSEEHTSELQSQFRISYAVFCLKKKKTQNPPQTFKMNNSGFGAGSAHESQHSI